MKNITSTFLWKTLLSIFMLGVFSGTSNAGLFSGINESSSGDNLFLSIDESNRKLKEKTKEKTFQNFKKKTKISSDLNKFYNGLKGTDLEVYVETEDTLGDLEKVARRSLGWAAALERLISDDLEGFQETEKSFIEAGTIAREFYYQKSILSVENANNAYDIASIGLYANGSLDDSPFDLIKDIEAINEVILGDGDLYEGGSVDGDRKGSGISPELRDFIDSVDENPYEPKVDESIKEVKTVIIPPKLEEKLKENGAVKIAAPTSSSVCLVDDTGLSENALKLAKGEEVEDTKSVRDLEKDISAITKVVKETYDENVDEDKKFIPGLSGYKPETDTWQCKEGQIICVKVDFLGYNQGLIGKSGTNSIDKVVTKANKHLRKGAFTSKIQSEMAINNFELNLKNLDLTTIFGGGIIVEYKPIPLLNLNEGKEQTLGGNKYESEKIFEKSLNSIGMNGRRENDLTEFMKLAESKVSTLNSQGESIFTFAETDQFIEETREEKEKQLDIISVNVNNLVKSAGNNEDLNMQMIELKTFIGRIVKHSGTLEAISKRLNLEKERN